MEKIKYIGKLDCMTYGKVYNVVGEKEWGLTVINDNGDKLTIMPFNLIDATPSFKIGDEVRVIGNVGSRFGHHCHNIGDIFTIKRVNNGIHSDHIGYKSDIQTLIAEELELVTNQESKDDKGEFIIWSPEAAEPPKKRYYSYKQARYVASKRSGEHQSTFYVLRAECVYNTQPCVTTTTKEEL